MYFLLQGKTIAPVPGWQVAFLYMLFRDPGAFHFVAPSPFPRASVSFVSSQYKQKESWLRSDTHHCHSHPLGENRSMAAFQHRCCRDS